MDVNGEHLASGGAGAARPQRAAIAVPAEAGLARRRADRHGDPVGAGGSHRGQVDREVVGGEPVGDGGVYWDRFDRRRVPVVGEMGAELTGAVGGVGEHLDR